MKAKYKFVKWYAKRSSCAGSKTMYTYSIGIVPQLQNERSGKIVDGTTAYRISGVTAFSDVRMIEMAEYIAEQATKRFDHEHVAREMWRSWRKDYGALHAE